MGNNGDIERVVVELTVLWIDNVGLYGWQIAKECGCGRCEEDEDDDEDED
jgi:hypothetical protein